MSQPKRILDRHIRAAAGVIQQHDWGMSEATAYECAIRVLQAAFPKAKYPTNSPNWPAMTTYGLPVVAYMQRR